MKVLLAIARGIDAVNDTLGRWMASLTLIMVLVTVIVVVLRYGFSIGFIWMQESVRFMHCFVFFSTDRAALDGRSMRFSKKCYFLTHN